MKQILLTLILLLCATFSFAQELKVKSFIYNELKESLTAEQVDKLEVLLEEMGVLFTISLFHNLKKF